MLKLRITHFLKVPVNFQNENQSWVVKGLGLDAQNFVQKSLEYKFSGGMEFLKFNFYWDIHAINITNFKCTVQWVLTDVYIVVQLPPQSRCITFLFFFYFILSSIYFYLFILAVLYTGGIFVPSSGIKPMSLALGRWILIHCTIREVWRNRTFKNVYFIYPITIMYIFLMCSCMCVCAYNCSYKNRVFPLWPL